MSLHLTLIAHGATAATRNAAFPLGTEDLTPDSAAKAASAAATLRRVDAAWTSPARAASQTADALGLAATVTPALADLDVGRWSGLSLDALATAEPGALAAWRADPAASPHGGETINALIARTAAWLATLDRTATRVVAVAHAATLRAAVVTALAAPPAAFWRIDVAPLYRLRLSGLGTGWTLRSIVP